jgi:hypothetical protein
VCGSEEEEVCLCLCVGGVCKRERVCVCVFVERGGGGERVGDSKGGESGK